MESERLEERICQTAAWALSEKAEWVTDESVPFVRKITTL